MVVGWPGSEAADRASGPPHAFEARANRTLPHRCNLLLAYHCLLACFARLLLQGTIMADQWEVAEELLDFAALQANPIDEEGSELERLLEEEYNGYDGDLGYEEPTMLVAALASARLDSSGDANGGGSSDGASGSGTRQGSSSSVTQRPPHEEATLGEVIPSMPGGPALASQAKSRSQKQVKNSTKMVYETAKFSFLRGAALAVPSAVPSRGCPHSALSRCPRAALGMPSRRPHSTKLGFARSCGQFTWHCEHRGRTHSMPCSALGARLNSRWQRSPGLIPASQVVGRSSSCCRAYAHFFMMRRNSNS
jgi:hypothetical protein